VSASQEVDIRAALVQGYVDANVGLATAHENEPFVTPSGTPWAKVTVVAADRYPVTLGDQGEDQHDGFMQVDLSYPTDSGTYDVLTKAGVLEVYFKAGRKLTYNGQAVTVLGASRSSGRYVDGWYRVSVTINWYARTSRA